VLALLVAVAPAARGAAAPDVVDALVTIDAALGMEELSRELWPSWDISGTAVALICGDGSCYLINHPKPPRNFERVKDFPVTIPVYSTTSAPKSDRRVCKVEGVPTAIISKDELREDALAIVFSAAFEALESRDCGERVSPVVLVSGYPVDAENLVLADIECELLLAAVRAPDDSIEQRAEAFAGLRRHRRMRIGPRYSEYERRIEFKEGISTYLAERCRSEAPEQLEGDVPDGLRPPSERQGQLEAPPADSLGLDWYREDRFGWTGALVCKLLDRLSPDWKEEAWGDCVDPFEILWRRVEGRTPIARVILAQYDYDEMVAGRSSVLEGMKTDAERHFEDIAGNEGGVLSISTQMLASGEVTYESAGIERVDAHRLIHRRILEIRYSWGTRFECRGAATAVVLGEDEFDFRRLILRLPEEFSITLDGQALQPEHGVYRFDESLVFSAQGIVVEAHAGTVKVGESGVSLILHR
jgi:hypothetical protein